MTRANRVYSLGSLNGSCQSQLTSASLVDFFRSRGSFTHNMRTSSLAHGQLLLTKWTFSGRITQRHTDLINGPLSKRASGPFYGARERFVCVFFVRAFPVSRANLCSSTSKVGGTKDIPAPLPKKWGAMAPLAPLLPPPLIMADC